MSLQAAIERTLPRLRAQAESRMTSRCAVMRDSGQTTTSPTTGRQVKVWDVVHSGEPCRIGRGDASRTESSGGVEIQMGTRTISFRHDLDDLLDDDLAEVTSESGVVSVWRLIDTAPADQRTARRIQAIQVSRPVEWA